MTEYTKGFLITFLGVVIISPDTLLIRLIDMDTWALVFWRGVLSGSTILLVLLLLKRKRFFTGFAAMGRSGIWITGIFSLGTICFMYSVTHTTVANTLFITSTSPVFAALIARFFLAETVDLRTWLTIAASMGGIGIIASGSLAGGAGSIDGDVAALGGAISLAAVFSIARVRRAQSMVPAMGLAGILSGLFVAPLAPSLAVPVDDVIWLVLLGLVVVPIGFGLLATGPRYLTASNVSLLLLLESIFGPLLVWWVLAEHPGGRTLIGGSIVLGAMAISNVAVLISTRRKRAT